MKTGIQACTCAHAYQDKKYGKGNRVHNKTVKHPSSQGGWRCSVCKATKS